MNKTGIVLSGGVSLGTYETGVMTSFLQAMYENNDINVSCISGASAGAITAFIFGYTLFKGISPYALRNVWTESADIKNMFNLKPRNLLDFSKMRKEFKSFLEIDRECIYQYGTDECKRNRCNRFCSKKICRNVRKEKIKVIIEMTALEGYISEITDKVSGETYKSKLHNDSFIIDFKKYETYRIDDIIDAVFSSAAMQMAFQPFNIKRDRKAFKYPLSKDYSRDDITLNYVDGGVTDNLPFKSLFDNSNGIKNLLMVMPHPFDVDRLIEHCNKYGGFGICRSQLSALFNANNASIYQSLYHDINILFSTNNTISDFNSMLEQGKINKEQYDEIMKVTGNTNKNIVDFTVITPKDPIQELSGEILSHFGGFLDKRVREWDFYIGYEEGMKFLKGKGYT
ncbi:patatin-like phospholipase family protein, partial [candidate division WOR-3 bacterium]|nr:patatin-like phospholipase family protein [candidate division WOR-3 bacterium]